MKIGEFLRVASRDCMHEHRRMKQMKELFDVRDIALKSGALMSTLSGSGSLFSIWSRRKML